MMSIADEIVSVSENAEKCILYPIGDKLSEFIRLQDESNQTNFVLSGVLIFAAAKIYGRKVDYLEQEIHGIAKNFEAVDQASNELKPEKEEKKKTRTKKFVIKDRVNLEKTSFEEVPIRVLQRIDINKTLALPSKINRLQKMKEFFAKSKSRSGKLVIPKTLLFNNDFVLSNFGSTQIYDFDDYKEVVGSRRDFTSFSYFVNSGTGELQSDLNVTTNTHHCDDDYHTGNNLSIPQLRAESPDIWEDALSHVSETPSRPNSPVMNFELSEIENNAKDPKEFNINLDEGIGLDEEERANLLLPIQPIVRLIDFRVKSPNLFPSDIEVNDSVEIDNFQNSVLTIPHEMTEGVTDFSLPSTMRKGGTDLKLKNFLMIPLKKLQHRCIFDLPNDDYGELKKLKREQFKPSALDLTMRQMRAFKTLEMMKAQEAKSDEPFRGFTTEEQQQPLTYFPHQLAKNNRCRSRSPLSERKYSNDSGFEIDSAEETANNGNLSEPSDVISSDPPCSISASDSLTINTTSDLKPEASNANISSGDSCYHSCYNSLASGDSMKTDLSSFFKDIESQNNTADDSNVLDDSGAPNDTCVTDESMQESEERVLQMQQSAVNIAKWKEYLKPILADSEARSKIDMHQCGIEMIDKIGNVNDTKSLDDITEAGKTPAYFLTMLQLINNRNVDINYGERSMTEPVDMKNIQITVKSKVLHREKFDEMGQQFELEEEKKTILKRKAVKTSTPARFEKKIRMSLGESTLNLSSPNASRILDEDEPMLSQGSSRIYSQASSGYFSQNSVLSDC